MAFDLSIRFHGIIGWVVRGEKVVLLLCKAGRRVVPNQVAYVRFPKAAYKSDNKRKMHPRKSGEPCDQRHVILKREHLFIKATMKQQHRKLELDWNYDPFRSKTPTSADEKSLRWVPDMKELGELSQAKKPGQINPDYFNHPKTVAPRLIATIELDQGMLGTTGFDSVLVSFHRGYSRTGDPKRIPLARELLLRMTVDSNEFFIESRPFGNRPPNAMHFVCNDDKLELVVGNESAADIYTESLPIQPIDTLNEHCMAEFKTYYKMCVAPPQDEALPFLSSRPGSETCCSVAQFVEPDTDVADAQPELAQQAANQQQLPWAVLAYLAADNNLSALADDNVDELENPHPHGVEVLVQVDRLAKRTERLVLEDEGFVPVPGKKLKNLNAGNKKVLTDFLLFGRKQFPKRAHAVFLLSHGAGLLNFSYIDKKNQKNRRRFSRWFVRLLFRWRVRALAIVTLFTGRPFPLLDLVPTAVGSDHSASDYLDNRELADAFLAALKGNPFPIIGFDACVMALVEMAYEMRDCGQFLVASQDDVHVAAFPYEKVLRRMAGETAERVACHIVDEYGKATQKQKYATLSAIRLSAIEDLVKKLNVLGDRLSPLVGTDLKTLAVARQAARAFATFHYIDLHGFVGAISQAFPEIKPAADSVLAALKQAVVCATKSDPPAHGLSVYLPDSRVADEYEKLSFYTDAPKWTEFVKKYASAVRR